MSVCESVAAAGRGAGDLGDGVGGGGSSRLAPRTHEIYATRQSRRAVVRTAGSDTVFLVHYCM